MNKLAIISAALISLGAAGAANAQPLLGASEHAVHQSEDSTRLAIARTHGSAHFGAAQTFGYPGAAADPVESASVVPGSSYAIRTNEEAERAAIAGSPHRTDLVRDYTRSIPVPGSDGF
ncbi:hypothetical protein [Mangrovibrevibacter kandeliae]|uniref:hypothetical protein n=1 Tax=Mangrovibrevibacter kandeliae TaxID=2968473 RepID=UPI0021196DC3|nr:MULTISPECIES: hypothetical protein [unclassified Aurantimonas]MCQ8781827.1 hypothetical protein [Aurantimonas sp. CSK15Z-1]MCW4115516.1 hypothetical protein [Aurantimonas sp. MSK8Z-1]